MGKESLYTNQECAWASQMAYCNITDTLVEEIKDYYDSETNSSAYYMEKML